MRLLVTGGAGFIGSHFVDRRMAGGDRVVVLDDFNDFYDPALKRRNVAAHLGDARYRLVEGDIRDRGLVFSLFEEEPFDAVVHLAARAGVRPSLADPILYEEVNGIGTLHLLAAAQAHGRPRFVFASSSSRSSLFMMRTASSRRIEVIVCVGGVHTSGARGNM